MMSQTCRFFFEVEGPPFPPQQVQAHGDGGGEGDHELQSPGAKLHGDT